MTILGGWVDWAQRRDGVANKVYSAPNQGLGLALHSMEGSVAGSESRFLSTATTPDGSYTPYATASTMFALALDGTLIQYYPVTASTWTSGNRQANTTLWAIESEGFAGSPLNEAQVATMIGLCYEFEAHTGRVATRDFAARTLWEHNEVWAWVSPNAGSTSCPSGRYQTFYDALEDEMTLEDRAKLEKAYKAFLALCAGNEFEIDAWNARGNSLLLGYTLEQQKLGQHLAQPHGLGG